MTMSLPRKHVFLPVLEFSASNFQNADPKYREASVMSLGVISEGCFEVMKNKLESILTIVLQSLKDPEQIVRGAASFTLGQFAEHLRPEIAAHYEIVLPCIMDALGDVSTEVQEKKHTMHWLHSVSIWGQRSFLISILSWESCLKDCIAIFVNYKRHACLQLGLLLALQN